MKWLLSLVLLVLSVAPAWAQENTFKTLTLQSAAVAVGNGVPIITDKFTSITVQVTIATTATVTFEVTQNGTAWASKACVASNSTDGVPVTTASSTGLYQCNIAALSQFRARISAWTAGAVDVTATVSTTIFARVMSGLPAIGEEGECLIVTEGVPSWEVCTISEVDTIGTAAARGRTDFGANSAANGFCIGASVTECVNIYWDATLGGQVRPKVDANTKTIIPTNFTWCLFDIEAAADVLCADPDAASKNAMYQFGANYKPIMSFLLPLEPRGAATSASESIVSNQPKAWYLTVTDANTDAADFFFNVTSRMVGATTVTFRLVGVSKHATPSGNIDFDCAMSKYTPGTDTFAAHVTTGEVTALLTPATQNRSVAVTTAAHTINGTLAAGDIVYGSCEVDAAATTSAQMSDFRLYGYVLVQLLVNSLSD